MPKHCETCNGLPGKRGQIIVRGEDGKDRIVDCPDSVHEARDDSRRRLVGISVDIRYGHKWPVFRVSDLGDANPDGAEVQSICSAFQKALDLLDGRVQP